MGGSFSAPCADLHSVWALFNNVSLLKRYGTLIQRDPIPLWDTWPHIACWPAASLLQHSLQFDCRLVSEMGTKFTECLGYDGV